jgi:hypothetical protein
MTAVAFAIPARVTDAAACRPTMSQDRAAAIAVDHSDVPFATWPELRELQREGVLDIQTHTLSHSTVFAGSDVVGFVTPVFAARPLLDRPELSNGTWLSPDSLGAPLYLERSRMSDALRFYDDAGIREQCMRHVAAHGGPDFFQRPAWRSELLAIASRGHGQGETETDRRAAVEDEIVAARAMLEERLGKPAPHVCMPWGIGGSETRAALKRTGQKLAFVDRLFGRRAVAPNDDPHSLMRLHERFITCLPGRGRRHFFNAR